MLFSTVKVDRHSLKSRYRQRQPSTKVQTAAAWGCPRHLDSQFLGQTRNSIVCNALVRLPDQLELTGGGTIQTLWPQVHWGMMACDKSRWSLRRGPSGTTPRAGGGAANARLTPCPCIFSLCPYEHGCGGIGSHPLPSHCGSVGRAKCAVCRAVQGVCGRGGLPPVGGR